MYLPQEYILQIIQKPQNDLVCNNKIADIKPNKIFAIANQENIFIFPLIRRGNRMFSF